MRESGPRCGLVWRRKGINLHGNASGAYYKKNKKPQYFKRWRKLLFLLTRKFQWDLNFHYLELSQFSQISHTLLLFKKTHLSLYLCIYSFILGWYCLIRSYRFQVHTSVIPDLYIALCAHHPKSSPATMYLAPFSTALPFGSHHAVVCVYEFQFYFSHMREIIWVSPFPDWLFSLGNIFSRSIRLVTNGIFHLSLQLSGIPSRGICVPHPLTHLSFEGHVSCLHVLAIMNNVTVSIGVHISLWINVLKFFR